jgi:glycosyltransferase involved in cell wall biosynthesis
VLINGVSARQGGGLTILRSLTSAIGEAESLACEYHVVCTDSTSELLHGSRNLKLIHVSASMSSLVGQYRFYRKALPEIVSTTSVDVVFNLADAIPHLSCPQVYYFDWAYLVCSDARVWSKLSLAERLYRRLKSAAIAANIGEVSAAIAQNELMRERLQMLAPNVRVDVVPPLVQLPRKLPVRAWERHIQLLCLSHYAPHKNLWLLVDLAKLLKAQKESVSISVTVNEAGCTFARRFSREIRRQQLTDYIIPIGPVGPSDLRKTVARHHALLIPSLLESFGLTYFEAMSFGRTVIAADTEYARAACGDAAFYFRPCDASDALLHIQLARESIGIRSQRLAIGLEIAKQFPRVDVSMRCLDQLMFEIAANQEMMP